MGLCQRKNNMKIKQKRAQGNQRPLTQSIIKHAKTGLIRALFINIYIQVQQNGGRYTSKQILTQDITNNTPD